MLLNNDFQERIESLFGAAGRDWLTSLPDLTARLATNWAIRLEEPFQNLTYSYVAPATRQDGQRVVLKVQPPNHEFRAQIEALKAFPWPACVQMLEWSQNDYSVLLERLQPGEDLATMDDERATSIAAELMKRLWIPPPDAQLPTVQKWSKGFNRYLDTHGSNGPLPQDLVTDGRDTFIQLSETSAAPVLLHGDLHHYNILSSRDRWKAIDPKGVIGEPAYEAGAFLRNPLDITRASDFRERTSLRLDLLSETLHIDRERIKQWAYAQAVLSACWAIEDGESAWEHALTCSLVFQEA